MATEAKEQSASLDSTEVFTTDFIASVPNERKKRKDIAAEIVRLTKLPSKTAVAILDDGPKTVRLNKAGGKAPIPTSATTRQWRRAEAACREVRKTLGDEVWSKLTPIGVATAAARVIDSPRPRNPYLYQEILKVMTW